MAFSKLNIAPVVSPQILKNISASTAINSFGTQLKDKAKEKLITGIQGAVDNLKARMEVLTADLKALGEKQKTDVEKAQKEYDSKQITKEEYDARIKDINKSILAAQKAIEVQINKLKEDIRNAINNPYDQLKKEQAKLDAASKSLKKRIQGIKISAKKDLIKQVALNSAKTLAPVIALQLANSLGPVISQRKKLEILVNQVNGYIDTQVKDEQTVIIATNLRNSAITLIDNSINKLKSIQNILKTITTLISLFNLIIPLLNPVAALPVITTVPGAPIPGIIIHDNIRDRKFNLQRLVSSLSAVLVVVTSLLSNEILKLVELRERLKEISLKLDGKTLTNLNDDQFSDLTNLFAPVGVNEFPTYKGFKFNIKEEQNPQFVVKGNKRRYAVAIDSNDVEVLKSEFSFTQDPNDLVEQLKIVIDQENLQG